MLMVVILMVIVMMVVMEMLVILMLLVMIDGDVMVAMAMAISYEDIMTETEGHMMVISRC